MKTILKISGTLTAIAFFILTLLLFVFWTNVLEIINQSYSVLNFVRNNIVDQNSATRCIKELIWVTSIFMMVVLVITVLFFRIQKRRKLELNYLFYCFSYNFTCCRPRFSFFWLASITIARLMDRQAWQF